jgi:ribosomal-protein-alanine N-acetyltransferase
MNPKVGALIEGRAALGRSFNVEESALTAEKLLSAAGVHDPKSMALARMDLGCPPIDSERLFLRKPIVQDLRLFNRTLGDSKVMQYMAGRFSRDAIKKTMASSMRSWDLEGMRPGVVVEMNSLQGVGIASLQRSRIPDESGLEIGWAFVREAQGKGYGTEISRPILYHAFENLRADRVLGGTSADNAASNRVFQKLNFKLLYECDVQWFPGRQNIWELRADAWRAAR